MTNILEEIFAYKRQEVALRKAERPLSAIRSAAECAEPALDFIGAVRRHVQPGRAAYPRLIAEVKKASPSRGLLAPDFDPQGLARLYQENGAAAISVLTDERYFQGSLDILTQIAALRPRLPLLRKDFVCDPYQVYEARLAGADAILLIVAMLSPAQLKELHDLARQLGMAALVEVHSEAEMRIALDCHPALVGINNRDLRDFSVHLETSLSLRPLAPAEVCLVAESGIHTQADAALLGAAGVDAILVGEALVTASDVGAKVRSLANPAFAGEG